MKRNTYKDFLGVEEFRCLREQVAGRVKLHECRRSQTHGRTPGYDGPQDDLTIEMLTSRRSAVDGVLTEHENR